MTASVGILPLALILLLPGLKKQRAGSGFLLLWLVLSFFAWHLTFRTFRYVMPVMALGYLWLGAALAQSLREPGVRERALKFAVCLALVVNGATFLGLTDYVNRSVAPALGTMSPERYIMRGFYSSFPREVPSHNAPNRLFEMIKSGKAPSSMTAELQSAGFTHILFNPDEWERMAYRNRSAPLWQLTAAQKAKVIAFLQARTDLVFESNGVSVHRIPR
jgi:hypothetical protein